MRGSVRVALGRIGGAAGIARLVRECEDHGGALANPSDLAFSALALGLHAWQLREAGRADAALRLGAHVAACAEPMRRGHSGEVLLLALGLCGHPALLDHLEPQLVEPLDYAAVAQACELFGDPVALPRLLALQRRQSRSEHVSAQARLGVESLVERSLAPGDAHRHRYLPALAAIAGDRDVDALLALLVSDRANERQTMAAVLPCLLSPSRDAPIDALGRGWNYRWTGPCLLLGRY